VPWGEIFSALQDSNLSPEDMRDLQAYMLDRIKTQRAAQAAVEEQKQRMKRRRIRRGELEGPGLATGTKARERRAEEEGGCIPKEEMEAASATAIDGSIEGAIREDKERREVENEEDEEEKALSKATAAAAAAAFDWKSSLESFQTQSQVIARSVALRKSGNERLAAGDVDEAVSLYEEALAVLERGTVVETGRTRVCAYSCRLNIAVGVAKRGEHTKAVEIYTTLLRVLDEGRDEAGGREERAVRWQCLTKRARMMRRLGRVEEAFADLVEANRLRPSDRKVAAELEEMGGTPSPLPPSPPPSLFPGAAASPLDTLLGGEGGGNMLGNIFGSIGSGSGMPGMLEGGGDGGGGNVLEGLMGKYVASMGTRLLDVLEQPETLNTVCVLLKKLEFDYLKSLAVTANLPVSDATIRWVHTKAMGVEPEEIRRWIGRGKWARAAYVSTKRTWASVQPLVRPVRLLVMYALVLRWIGACVGV